LSDRLVVEIELFEELDHRADFGGPAFVVSKLRSGRARLVARPARNSAPTARTRQKP